MFFWCWLGGNGWLYWKERKTSSSNNNDDNDEHNDNMRRRWGHDWWLGIFLVHPPDRSMARGYAGHPTQYRVWRAQQRAAQKIWSKSKEMLPLGRVRIVFRLSLGARRKSRAHCHRPKIVSRVQRLPVREGLDYDWSVTLCCLQMKSLCAQLPPSRWY